MANPADVLARLHRDREEIRQAVNAMAQRHADSRRAVEELVEGLRALRRCMPREDRELVEACLAAPIDAAATAFGVP